MGLREIKKRRLRRDIIENAIALFRERGIEATRVQDIIERVEISEATFFNYFPGKESVLSEWLHDRVDEALQTATARGDGLRRALRGLAGELALTFEAEAPLLDRARSRIRVLPSSRAGGGPAPADAPQEPASQLFRVHQDKGEIRRDLSPEELGLLLRAAIVACLTDPSADRGSLEGRLQRSLDLLLDGSRKRNERVRPGAHASPAAP